jgi:hypothetical protein
MLTFTLDVQLHHPEACATAATARQSARLLTCRRPGLPGVDRPARAPDRQRDRQRDRAIASGSAIAIAIAKAIAIAVPAEQRHALEAKR